MANFDWSYSLSIAADFHQRYFKTNILVISVDTSASDGFIDDLDGTIRTSSNVKIDKVKFFIK